MLSLNSIRSRIILCIILSTLPLLGFFLYNFLEDRQTAIQEAKNNLLRIAKQVSNTQEHLIQEAHELLRVISSSRIVRQQDAAACTSRFGEIIRNHRFLANLTAATPDGRVFSSAKPMTTPVNLADFPFFQEVLKTGKFSVGSLHRGQIIGEIALNMGLPVLDQNDEVQVVLMAAISISWLKKQFDEANLPAGSFLAIINGQGAVMARYPNPEHWVGKSRTELLEIVLTNGRGVAGAVGMDGTPRFYALHPLKDVSQNAFVYVGVPTNLVHGPPNRHFYSSLLMLLLVACFAFLVARQLFQGFILSRLEVLTRIARQVATGDLKARTCLTAEAGELGQQVVTFDQMLDALQQREDDLRQAEERYHNLVLNVPIGLYRSTPGPKGRFLLANSTMVKIFGYESIDEFMQIHPADLYEDSSERQLLSDEMASKGQLIAKELRLKKKDGILIWGAMTAHSVCNRSGEMLYFDGFVEDITDKKLVEEALRESEEKYRLLVNQIPAVVYKGYPDWSVDIFDPKVEELTGYSMEEFNSRRMKFVDLILPEDVPEAKNKFTNALKNDNYFVREYRIRKKGGEIAWIHNRGQIFCDPAGQVDHVSGVLFDVTDRKQADDKIRTATQKWRATFDGISDAVCLLDRECKILQCNQAMTELAGKPFDAIIGRPCWEIMHSASAPIEGCPFVRMLQSHQKESLVLPMEDRWLNIKVDPILNESGEVSGAVHIVSDLTEIKRAEQALTTSYAKLKQTMAGIVQAMAMNVEIRDPYTSGHQRRVTKLAKAIAREMHLSNDQLEGLCVAGTLHDLGKVYVPEGLLSRPGRLTDVEFALIKTHCQKGYEILQPIEFPWPVAEIVRQHHEKMDGSGYPTGLKGEEILPEARILAVADVVEAMASHRPYRAALGIEAALEEISRNKGILYDPQVVEACLSLFKEKGFQFD